MERRDFLKVGTAAGVASVAGPACSVVGGGQLLDTPSLSDSEMGGYLTRLDRGLEAISGGDLLDDLLPRRSNETSQQRRQREQGTALARTGLRSLLLTGMYKDLPQADRLHPGMQQRLERGAPEMDQALFGMTGLMAGTTSTQRDAIQAQLRKQPDFGLRLAESLNRPAKKLGVSMKRRAQLRTMSTHLSWRMRVQSPSLVMDDVVGKVQRVASRNGQHEELKRHLATRIGEETFWRHQTRLAMAGGASEAVDDDEFFGVDPAQARQAAGLDEPGVAAVRSEPFEVRPPVKRRGGALISTGLWMMGTGAGTVAIGGGIVAAGSLVGAFVMTAGGVAIVAGLIILAIGLIIRY